MIFYQPIEQRFVGVLDIAQVDMFIDLSFKSLILDPGTLGLFFNGFNDFRQQPEQVEIAAFFHAERAAFIEQRKFQQNRSRIGDIKGTIVIT